jgi:hypothetical protein
MVALHTRIANNSFVQFEIGSDHFGIKLLQSSFLTLTELEVMKRRGKDVVICPANQAVYSTEIDSCALSLFQQTPTRDV